MSLVIPPHPNPLPKGEGEGGADADEQLGLEFDDGFDLDACAKGEGCHSDCGAGVPAGVAEYVAEELGSAVDDQVLLDEIGVGVDESDDLQHSLYFFERADLLADEAEDIRG